MKYCFILFILLLSFAWSSAQTETSSAKSPKWLCDKGFWVIESNIKTPKNATIFFYNNNKQLIYKEVITNKYINTKRLRIRKRLEAVLVEAIARWEKENIVHENQQLVASRL